MIKNDKEEVEEESLVADFVLDSLEKELYESLCREPMPYVRVFIMSNTQCTTCSTIWVF